MVFQDITVYPQQGASPPQVLGVGPVISGWLDHGRRPVYLFEVLYESGETETIAHEKAGPGTDQKAKRAALLDRIRRAHECRRKGDLVLAHDEASFRALRAMALRFSASKTAA